mmetsp:Transcript_69845/g.197914  ORF Transcript_69845/g.197914 Transcript_69845/m.197914 type:complete len:226 (+) Transcript_69845:1952-2629(+)
MAAAYLLFLGPHPVPAKSLASLQPTANSFVLIASISSCCHTCFLSSMALLFDALQLYDSLAILIDMCSMSSSPSHSFLANLSLALCDSRAFFSSFSFLQFLSTRGWLQNCSSTSSWTICTTLPHALSGAPVHVSTSSSFFYLAILASILVINLLLTTALLRPLLSAYLSHLLIFSSSFTASSMPLNLTKMGLWSRNFFVLMCCSAIADLCMTTHSLTSSPVGMHT